MIHPGAVRQKVKVFIGGVRVGLRGFVMIAVSKILYAFTAHKP